MSTQTATPQIVNGLNVTQFTETVRALEADPALAACRFRARNTWVDGAHNRTEIQGFHAAGGEDTSRAVPFVHDADEPPVLEGRNLGANPVEYVLTGLAGCLTTTLVYYGALMGITLDRVESTLEGDLDLRGLLDLDPDVRPGYSTIRVSFRIESDAPRERLEQLVAIAKRFSPVCSTVQSPVEVSVELEA